MADMNAASLMANELEETQAFEDPMSFFGAQQPTCNKSQAEDATLVNPLAFVDWTNFNAWGDGDDVQWNIHPQQCDWTVFTTASTKLWDNLPND